MNQYIYFSSKNSDNPNDAHSDFAVNFSNPVVIPAYAEIRCVNCRVNPDNNVYNVVEGENDKLAFSVSKWWIEENGDVNRLATPPAFVKNPSIFQNGFPLFSIKLTPGNYDLADGTDITFNLNAQIEHQINQQITNIPNIRNGVSCEINANKKLTIKVSLMGANGYYQIPDGTNLPQDLLDKMGRMNSVKSVIPIIVAVGGDPPILSTPSADDGSVIMSSPFNMRGVAAGTDMIPPNQVSAYDVSCDTLAGGNFQVGDTIEIVADTSITGKVLAVAANLPTKIEIYQTSDLWKTDDNAANVNIQKTGGAITCRITDYTSAGPDWRGVNLYAIPNSGDNIANDCKYFVSPPVVWNSLGDWENSTQYKLASIFSIDLSSYAQQGNQDNLFRFCYSCFGDSIDTMGNSASSAGLSYGQYSGTVIPYDYGMYNPLATPGTTDKSYIEYDFPSDRSGDSTTDVPKNKLSNLQNYIYRIQLNREEDDLETNLEVQLKRRGTDDDDAWSWGVYKNLVTDDEPEVIELDHSDFSTTKLCFETYVMAGVENNANKFQLVIKKKVGAGAWETIFNVRDIIANNLPFHMLTSSTAADSKKNKPANIRFSYSHNAPLTETTTGDNFKSFDKIYFASAYNPIDEANGFVDGQFRDADYITAENANLPSEFSLQIYGQDELRESVQNNIASTITNGGIVVPWDAGAENFLEQTDANGGAILGLDEEGVQYITSNTYTDGVEFEGNVNLNQRDFPQHYLDLPDLAVNNHTGTCNGTGRPNRFICPLDLNSGQSGKQDIHTSQNETLLYNDLGNAYEQQITRLRFRICDIEGTPSQNLGEYTYGCLEIRENPAMKQAKMLKRLMSDEERAVMDYQNNLQPSKRTRYQ